MSFSGRPPSPLRLEQLSFIKEIKKMKSAMKLTAVVLILALASWAQTATQAPANPTDTQNAAAAQSETKAGCPCCQKMAQGKDAMSCCTHQKDAKNGAPMSCCGRDGSSCMKGDKSAKASCTDCKCCNGQGEKDCCAKCAKNSTMAMTCCGHGHCGMGHDHANIDK